MRVERNGACPCGSGQKAKRCCLPAVEGQRHATGPEALLRARFCAYGWGAVDYLMATCSGDARSADPRWRDELVAYCAVLTVNSLAIALAETAGDTGAVSYTAALTLNGRPVELREKADYVRIAGRWTYSGGTVG